MKLFNGIISILFAIASMYGMFIQAKTDMEFVIGFMGLLMSIIFMCFMLLEERKDEVEKLRHIIMEMKGIK
jgi:hypothetical protein